MEVLERMALRSGIAGWAIIIPSLAAGWTGWPACLGTALCASGAYLMVVRGAFSLAARRKAGKDR